MRRFNAATAAASAALLLAACGTEPTAPELPVTATEPRASYQGSLNVSCPAVLDVGESRGCQAWVWQGGFQMVIFDATWYSTDPGIVTAGAWGQITGVSPGQATIVAEHQGSTGSAVVQVTPPFTVSISGPGQVGTNQVCGFDAFVSGAAGSVQYSWQAQGATGTALASTWEGSSSGSGFTLTVTASSGGRSASATKHVTVTPGFLALCRTSGW